MIDLSMIDWSVLPAFAICTGGGVIIGLIGAPPVKRRVKRQGFCVVRVYPRPEAMEILFESRSQKACTRWRAQNRSVYAADGQSLYIKLRSEVDEFNAQAMAKPTWWDDYEVLVEAYNKTMGWAKEPEPTQVIASPRPDASIAQRMDDLETTAERMLGLFAGMAHTLEVIERRTDGAGLPLLQSGGNDAGPHLPEVPGGLGRTVEPGSVMRALQPTEAIRLADLPVHDVLVGTDPTPTTAHGIARPTGSVVVVRPEGVLVGDSAQDPVRVDMAAERAPEEGEGAKEGHGRRSGGGSAEARRLADLERARIGSGGASSPAGDEGDPEEVREQEAQ